MIVELLAFASCFAVIFAGKQLMLTSRALTSLERSIIFWLMMIPELAMSALFGRRNEIVDVVIAALATSVIAGSCFLAGTLIQERKTTLTHH